MEAEPTEQTIMLLLLALILTRLETLGSMEDRIHMLGKLAGMAEPSSRRLKMERRKRSCLQRNFRDATARVLQVALGGCVVSSELEVLEGLSRIRGFLSIATLATGYRLSLVAGEVAMV